MKKVILSLITFALVGTTNIVNATNPNEALSDIVLVGLDSDSIDSRGVSLDDLSEALGEKKEVNETINNLLVSLFSEDKNSSVEIAEDIENASKLNKHYVVIESYEVEQKGYPYDNFLHVLSYAVYNKSNTKVLEGKQQFATLDCIDKRLLEKQLSKVVKKVITKVS